MEQDFLTKQYHLSDRQKLSIESITKHAGMTIQLHYRKPLPSTMGDKQQGGRPLHSAAPKINLNLTAWPSCVILCVKKCVNKGGEEWLLI